MMDSCTLRQRDSLHSPPGQKSSIAPFGLSILVKSKYGFAPIAHFGSTLSNSVSGAAGRFGSASSCAIAEVTGVSLMAMSGFVEVEDVRRGNRS